MLFMLVNDLYNLFSLKVHEWSSMRFSKTISSGKSQLSSRSIPFHPIHLLSNGNLAHACYSFLNLLFYFCSNIRIATKIARAKHYSLFCTNINEYKEKKVFKIDTNMKQF